MKLKMLIIILFSFFLIIFISLNIMMKNQEKKVQNFIFEKIDMSQIKDGNYIGESDTGLVVVEVKVNVKDNQITNIELLRHDNGFGGKAESIIKDMVNQNTYDVDVVSGATISSKVIKKAVYNALLQGTSENN